MSRVWKIIRFCSPMQFDPGQGRTHSQGVDQSTSPLQGVTQGGERERRGEEEEALERSGKSLSSLLSRCHTLWPLSVNISLCWPWASGGWHSASPSIHPSLPISAYIHIHKHVLSLICSRLFYLSVPRGFSSCSLHHSLPSPPFLPAQSYWFRPGALGC